MPPANSFLPPRSVRQANGDGDVARDLWAAIPSLAARFLPTEEYIYNDRGLTVFI